jgi:hypothetical protein
MIDDPLTDAIKDIVKDIEEHVDVKIEGKGNLIDPENADVKVEVMIKIPLD